MVFQDAGAVTLTVGGDLLIDAGGTFMADTVLAKHDEKYMPKDLADKLKEKGVWQETQGKTQ